VSPSHGARFLFAAWPFHGHLFPQIAIAHALRRRGHECAFYTGNQAADVVRHEGFDCFPFKNLDEAALEALMRSRPAEPWRPKNWGRLGSLMRRWLLDTIPQQLADLEEIREAWHPDVIGCDPTMWAPVLVLFDKYRLRVAICSFIPACPLPGPDAPPFGPGLPPPRSLRGRLISGAAHHLARISSAVGRRAANDVRRKSGLPPIDVSPTEYTGRMPLYLVPCTAQFDYGRHDLPDTVHYVGPYLWNRPHTEAGGIPVGELRNDVPCVHVTEGTMHVHQSLVLPAALEGLANLPMHVIATTGSNRTLADLGIRHVASNITIVPWVSHSDLLPRTDVMVTTGGAGSVLAALASGVPLVIVPTEWDKPEIAQRVVESGAGVRLDPRHCTPDRLRSAVARVLNDPAFRTAALRLAESFAQTGGADRAADLLVALSRRNLVTQS
jgi:MGT family glycosyltransferase